MVRRSAAPLAEAARGNHGSRLAYCHEMRPETIADVIDRMRAIGDGLPGRDGVACFTRLYLAVTETVRDANGFAAPEF